MGQITVTLNGRTYRLRCGDGEEQRLLELAGFVRQKIDRLASEFGQVGDDRLLVMAVLLITDELFDARASLEAQAQAFAHQMPPSHLPEAVPERLLEPPPDVLEAMPLPTPAASAPSESPARRLPRRPLARSTLEDRIAEVRDGTAPDRKVGGG